MVKPKKRRLLYKKSLFIFLILAGLAIIVIILLETTNTTHVFHNTKPKPVAVTGNASTKGSAGSVSKETANSQSSDSATSNTKQAGSTTNTSGSELIAPWGTFFNNSPVELTDQMGSTCNTTPGATCQIIFTNGTTTQSLEAENTDAGGAVYWSWTPQKVGLTTGTWHVTAKAMLGSQTKTTSNDPLTLEVTL